MSRDEIPHGLLELLILRTLARAKQMHGFEIAEAVRTLSDDVLRVEEGSLYPALQRLLVGGALEAKWGHTEENHRARYYRLTAKGRRQLDQELARYRRVSAAIEGVLRPA
ncbi:Transcriptional regulator, PadR family [Candidatus Sulfopaludibacter sp. SbA4]|nr:Transcriptional regulator, PadR family [Candidatus Sulfopaludibacter sp. SbA4]